MTIDPTAYAQTYTDKCRSATTFEARRRLDSEAIVIALLSIAQSMAMIEPADPVLAAQERIAAAVERLGP